MKADRFEKILASFPESVRPLLMDLPYQAGKLSAAICRELMASWDIAWEQLMVKLLPLAASFASVPVSEFSVGAVVRAADRSESSLEALYLGANLEFNNQPLNMTVHAEQSAVVNAWHQDGGRLLAIATSAPPCGYCRQFLHEFHGGRELLVILPGTPEEACRTQPLAELLPQPFTPADLDRPTALMSAAHSDRPLKLVHDTDDPLVRAALAAAGKAYAPYSGNLAACALQTRNKRIVCGRCLESVAFNPGVSPLQAAIVRINLTAPAELPAVERVVLVERPARIRQKESVQTLMKTVTPDVALEYHLAQEESNHGIS